MKNQYVITALILGVLAVILGAFGAHYLAEQLPEQSLKSYKTGVSYQFNHTLLMLMVGLNLNQFHEKFHKLSFYLLFVGILFFSGSIFLLSTRIITGLESFSILGPMTPIGGLLIIFAWISLIYSFIKKNKSERND